MTLDGLSVYQRAEAHGRADPSVTVVVIRTDATTVLERLALYEIKKVRSGIFSKNGTITIARQWLEAGRRVMWKGEVKLCLTGSGLEGL